MSDDGATTWQALSALPQIERDINEQFDNTREFYEHLCQGRDRANLLDDALVERVLRHVADQVEFLPVYRECRISSDWTPLISSEWDHPISG